MYKNMKQNKGGEKQVKYIYIAHFKVDENYNNAAKCE